MLSQERNTTIDSFNCDARIYFQYIETTEESQRQDSLELESFELAISLNKNLED